MLSQCGSEHQRLVLPSPISVFSLNTVCGARLWRIQGPGPRSRCESTRILVLVEQRSVIAPPVSVFSPNTRCGLHRDSPLADPGRIQGPGPRTMHVAPCCVGADVSAPWRLSVLSAVVPDAVPLLLRIQGLEPKSRCKPMGSGGTEVSAHGAYLCCQPQCWMRAAQRLDSGESRGRRLLGPDKCVSHSHRAHQCFKQVISFICMMQTPFNLDPESATAFALGSGLSSVLDPSLCLDLPIHLPPDLPLDSHGSATP